MAKGKGKKKNKEEQGTQEGGSSAAGPSQQQQGGGGGKGDVGQQSGKKSDKKGQTLQPQPQGPAPGQSQQTLGQQGQQQQAKGPQDQQQRGGPQPQSQSTGGRYHQGQSQVPQQPAPTPQQQQAWGRGQPQGRGQGSSSQSQQAPPGFGRGQPQGQSQVPQQPAPTPQQQQAWGRGQPQGRGQGSSSQSQQAPPGFGRGQPQVSGPPQGPFQQNIRGQTPSPFGGQPQRQVPPGFTQPQEQAPTQRQVRGGPTPQPQQPPTQQQQQRGPPFQQQQQRVAPIQQQKQGGAPPQQQQQRGPPPQRQQQREAPSQQQAGVGPRSKGPGPSGEVLTKGLKKLELAPRREDKGDETLVAKIRIKPGTEGRIIKVESNHISLDLGNLKNAYHYDVAIDPDTPKKFLRPVMELFRRQMYPNRYPAFDGKKNLYASKPLTSNLTDILADTVTMVEENGREKQFKVQIKYANTVDLTPLKNLLNHPVTPREALQCVDIVLRSAPARQLIPVGKSFFSKPSQIIDLGQGMEMYHGFFQSTIRGWKPLLNVDVAHKAFPKEINVIDTLAEVLSDPRRPMSRDSLRELRPFEKDNFNKFMRTLRVVYMIPNQPGTKREYRVNQLWDSASRATFTHEGRSMTVAEYFRNIKHHPLRYPDLPTLHVGSMQREDKILLPMEFCTIVAGQALNRKMTDVQTSNMIKYAATDTATRKKKIMTGVNMANYNSSPIIQEFGFSVGSQFQELNARVLQPPMLLYKDKKTAKVFKGVWRQNDPFLNAVTINKWTIRTVCSRPPRPDDLRNMATELQKAARNCGIVFASAPEEPYQNIGGNRADLRSVREHFTGLKNKYDVVFVVVPDSGPEYSYVKTAAEINVGCLTQCIKQTTLFRRMNTMTAANILLKVNAKLAGTNHAMLNRPGIMNRPVMMMGADVTHPGPDAKEIPSVAAVTASHDPKAFQYNICWRLQPPTVEIITDLENIMVEQLDFFFKKNNCKPEAIVFFRDGVSEGQFEQVKREEVLAIRRACKRVQSDGYEPKITFLVVQKRHHTRLFPLNPRDSEDRNCNVPAGTCVDTDITHPYMQDFYLVSHASIQGVAKPTKYCTLWDDNNMSNDDIEKLTYYLCHMFTRCNRSVSYPAPTYYAHLAAARGKVYIENERLDMDNLNKEFMKYTIKDEIRKGLPMFFV